MRVQHLDMYQLIGIWRDALIKIDAMDLPEMRPLVPYFASLLVLVGCGRYDLDSIKDFMLKVHNDEGVQQGKSRDGVALLRGWIARNSDRSWVSTGDIADFMEVILYAYTLYVSKQQRQILTVPKSLVPRLFAALYERTGGDQLAGKRAKRSMSRGRRPSKGKSK